MKLLRCNKINENDYLVYCIVHQYTKSDIKEFDIEVEEVIEVEDYDDRFFYELHINPITKEQWHIPIERELSEEEKIKKSVKDMQEEISILEDENKSLREGLQAVLRGDMQSLAYILYPEDFNNIEG